MWSCVLMWGSAKCGAGRLSPTRAALRVLGERAQVGDAVERAARREDVAEGERACECEQ